MAGRLLDQLKDFIRSYMGSFERGRRKYGVWWLIFTGSLIIVVIILVTFAAMLYLIILPRLYSA